MESTEEVSANKTEEAPKEVMPPKEKTPTPLPVKEVPLKRNKKEERQHKKDDRVVEQFLKSLDSLPTAEDKLAAVSKKFAETADENRRLQAFIKQSDKRFSGVAKEKEQLQLEYNRTVLVKSKLENLCRELQKQNKSIKEESLLKIREEEERRKETQAKFQSALSEITTLLQQNNEKNNKLRDDNINMTTKFKSVVEKYELREQQVDKMAKQMSLEQQLSEAKLAKASLEAQAERERLLSEIAQLKLELGQSHARIIEGQGLESSLRSQLAVYTDKYDEFQNALVKSNQVFGGFKGEIDKMSKKITKLEKECMSWKKRWETSQTALLEMVTDKRLWDERAAATDRQLAQLQRLCRTMQAERTVLLNTLKANNIERPPLPVLPPAPTPPPSAPSKIDAMATNCAQLKQSLAQLQNQLNVLTTKKEEENQAKTEEPAGKPKKGKGKKSKVDREKQENATKTDIAKTKEVRENSETIEEITPKSDDDVTPKEITPDIEALQIDEVDSSTVTALVESLVIDESTGHVKVDTHVDSKVDVRVESTDVEPMQTPLNDIPVESAVNSDHQSVSVDIAQAELRTNATLLPDLVDKTDGVNQNNKIETSNFNDGKSEQHEVIVTNGSGLNADTPKEIEGKSETMIVNGEFNGASGDEQKVTDDSALSQKDASNKTDETPIINAVISEKVIEPPQTGSVES